MSRRELYAYLAVGAVVIGVMYAFGIEYREGWEYWAFVLGAAAVGAVVVGVVLRGRSED